MEDATLPKFERAFVAKMEGRLNGDMPLIQVLVGPRQVGKTTGVRQLLERVKGRFFFSNSDGVLVSDQNWLI